MGAAHVAAALMISVASLPAVHTGHHQAVSVSASIQFQSEISEEDMVYRVTFKDGDHEVYKAPDPTTPLGMYIDSETSVFLGGGSNGFWAGKSFTGSDGAQWRAVYTLGSDRRMPEFSFVPEESFATSILATEQEALHDAAAAADEKKWDDYFVEFDGEGTITAGTNLYAEPTLESKILGTTEWPGLKEWHVSSPYEENGASWRKVQDPATEMGIAYAPAESVTDWTPDEPEQATEEESPGSAPVEDAAPVRDAGSPDRATDVPEALTAVPEREFPISPVAFIGLGGLIVVAGAGLTTYHLISQKRKGAEAK